MKASLKNKPGSKAPKFDHPVGRADSLEKTLMLGKMQEDKRATEDEMVK